MRGVVLPCTLQVLISGKQLQFLHIFFFFWRFSSDFKLSGFASLSSSSFMFLLLYYFGQKKKRTVIEMGSRGAAAAAAVGVGGTFHVTRQLENQTRGSSFAPPR